MPAPCTDRFLLLYGSQTGQAESISELISDSAHSNGFSVNRQCLSSTDKKFKIEHESCAVLVVSTTGEGEVPETALKFWRKLKKKNYPEANLKHLSYTILGLGDTNYNNFCNGGKTIHSKLQELGAQTFYSCGWADDAVGLESVVDPWIEGLWEALKDLLKSKRSSNTENTMDDSTTQDTNKESDSQVLTSTENENSDSNEQTATLPNNSLKEQILRNPLLSNSIRDIPLGVKLMEQAPHSNYIMDLADRPVDISNVELIVQENLPDEFLIKDAASLVACAAHLEDIAVTVPPLSSSYLTLTLLPEEKLDLYSLPLQNGASFPSMSSSVQTAEVLNCSLLTKPGAVKTTLDLELHFEDSESIVYQPGDSISVICPNNDREVNHLIRRLDLENAGDALFQLTLSPTTTKRNASIPIYFPPKCTIRYALTHCLDIRDPPKKALLRMFVEHTTDEYDKRRLQELCSKQGMSEYTTYVREPGLSLLDVLLSFPSVMPPFERLLELLPRLLPRPYSVASSQEIDKNKLHIAFNVIEIPAGSGRRYHRQGVCTGWLEQLTLCVRSDKEAIEEKTLHDAISSLTLTEKPQISIFSRTNQHFHLPSDPSVPLVMVGPGTGVAPFIGFLQHRSCLSKEQSFGESWLFYGCRHQKKDFLYETEINQFLQESCLTKFFDSFSRDEQPEGSARYVQDNMHLHSKELVDLIDNGAVIYVCGDAKNMSKDVSAAFASILASEKELTPEDAGKLVMNLRIKKRYLEDVWT